MKIIIKISIFVFLVIHSSMVFPLSWEKLWKTDDQRGAEFYKNKKYLKAAETFKNENWSATSFYKNKDYLKAEEHFAKYKTSDSQYNAANSAAFLGEYQKAVKFYDSAIDLDKNNKDAINNRKIILSLIEKNKQNKKDQDKENQDKDKQDKDKQDKEKQDNSDSSDNNEQKKNDYSKNNDENQESENPESDDGINEKKQNISTASSVNSSSEEQKQMLRRIPDKPQGLMKQKFLRDYLKRRSVA